MIARIHGVLQKPILYLQHKLSERQFLIFSSVLVGLSSGLAAVILKYCVHTIGTQIANYTTDYNEFFIFALLPLLGLIFTVVYSHRLLKKDIPKGSSEIVYSITKKSSEIPGDQMYSHVISSGITVGFGGSVGLESPMASTGAAIGSNYGHAYRLSYKDRTILLASGAAAGIAAAFNAPIAGVLFAVEVLLADVSASAFIPLIISAASGALLTRIILEEGVILSFSLQQPFDYHNVPFYIVLGILAGLVSLYYARAFRWMDHTMMRVDNMWKRAAIGGLLMFILISLFPPLFGEGYDTIIALATLDPGRLTHATMLKSLVQTEGHLLIFLGALIFLKTIAAAITLSSGGNGGNFGPALFVGAYLGFVFARLLRMVGFDTAPVTNLTLVAMAGILSGVFYAPLTAIFLIAEITGGYELMIPLMIVSSLSLTIVHLFEPLSMEGRRLSTKLNLSITNRDQFLLSRLDITDLIEKNFSTVHPAQNLQSLIRTVSASRRNQFPVVDEQEKLLGVVHMDSIRPLIFDQQQHESVTVADLMTQPAATIGVGESLHSALQKFEETRQWNLPVIEGGRYVGFLSKSSILSRYRNELLESV